MKYTIQKIIEKELEPRYIFFWGHQPSVDGSITKSCLSQWWLSSFTVNGIEYKTAEHWMMAKKAELFGDKDTFQKIIKSDSPAVVKQFGRTVANYVDEEWNKYRYEIVKEGNYHKFSQHTDLRNFLINTDKQILVETSPTDAIWGIGMAIDHKDIYKPDKWRGTNLLGFALMEVRDQLKIN